MKALRFHNARDLRLDEVSPPLEPLADQVVLKVLQCGICGTDLHEYVAGPIMLPVKPHPENGAKIPIIRARILGNCNECRAGGNRHEAGGSRRDSSPFDEVRGLLCSAQSGAIQRNDWPGGSCLALGRNGRVCSRAGTECRQAS